VYTDLLNTIQMMGNRIWPGLMMKLFELFCNVSDQSFSLVKMNSSPLSLTSLGGSRSRTFTSSPTSSLSTLSTNRVVSPGNSPFGLKQLSREIFEMVNGMGMMKTEEILSMDMAMMVGEGKEMMVHLRLFYLGVVHGKNDRMEVENKTLGRGEEDDGEGIG
jgi:hypothetical protein